MTRQAESDIMTVWVVSEGNGYNGYSICGVFSTREKAIHYMSTHNITSDHVWELSECKVDIGDMAQKYIVPRELL